MIEFGKIYNESCLDTMARCPDKSIDVILTDPPYGVGVDYGGFDDTRQNVHELMSKVVPEMLRVAKVVALTPGIGNFGSYPEPDWVFAWVYSPGHSYCPWGFNSWQPIFVWGKDPYLANRMGCREDVIKKTAQSKTAHPVPKSFADWRKLLNRVSVKQTDIVYDPFMGSGTTALVAEDLGRAWAGSEINPEFVKEAMRRVDEMRSQLRLAI